MEMDAEYGPAAPRPRGVESLPGEGEVHVWRVSLSPEETRSSAFESELSEDERERGGRFHFHSDAEKFIAAHGALRMILGAYAGLRPRDLMFSRSVFGKPSLIHGEESRTGLRFNMADSGEVALVAVSTDREVGVDIERMKGGADLSRAALRCFCDAEIELFRAAPEERREDIFYTFWSRKEAYIKARGEGMSLVLRDIDVSVAPALLDRRWMLEDLSVDPGYRGAVVLDGNISRVRYRSLLPHGAFAPE
jgi:4'-phosphopantetheinyl transferase